VETAACFKSLIEFIGEGGVLNFMQQDQKAKARSLKASQKSFSLDSTPHIMNFSYYDISRLQRWIYEMRLRKDQFLTLKKTICFLVFAESHSSKLFISSHTIIILHSIVFSQAQKQE
jgi:hypothetical protein